MKYENVQQAVAELKKLQNVMAAYHHALGVMHLDATTVAPHNSNEGRSHTMGIMSKITYDLMTNPENGELLSYLEANTEELDPQTRREVEELRDSYDKTFRVPADEYIAYAVLRNNAQDVWTKAKNNNDFASFAPYLEQMVAFKRKFAGYYNPEMEPYDSLLNEYEKGMNTKVLDEFFAKLREVIVPLIAKVKAAEQIDDSFLFGHFPIAKQRELSDYLMAELDIDRGYCGIGETEHPYTTNFNNKDVRITTHYHENALAFSLYSVMHEAGHGIYELGCDDCYNYTALSGGVSMSIHESQSRFFENLIGRSKEFCAHIFPKVQELFPEQMQGVDADMFYRAVNKAEPSLVRTEADELTYCLHIMIRYELEKQLIGGTLEVKDVPAAWNRMYQEYLGIDVPTDKEGCLQDSHWSGGMFGYFPSYALGSAYGPQLLNSMEQEIGSIYGDVANGDVTKVKAWLKEHIHRHAGFYKPDQLFEMACGKFDATYYTDYLTKKFSDLYQL